MNKEERLRIKALKKDKKYEEIFIQFGREAYVKNVPKQYRKKDVSKLSQEGKYEAIYQKYGESEHNKVLLKAMYEEIKENRGTIHASLWKLKQDMKSALKMLGLITGTSFLAITGTLAEGMKGVVQENAIKYESEILEYNEHILDYANKVNNMKLNDIQTFMKVMDDMWGSIKGYKTPEKDILGFLELDLIDEDGYGVCRNMAKDVARKLNAINPEYCARTMAVKMEHNGRYTIANIEQNILETNETVEEQEETEKESKQRELKENFYGNHMITLVDLKQYNITLVLDPTNPGVGIYQNGNIQMFNSSKENGKNFDAKEYISAVVHDGKGIEGVVNAAKNYIETYQKPSISMGKLEQLFGVEAQNKALEEVRDMEKSINENIESRNQFKEDIKMETESQFRERLKIETENEISLEAKNQNSNSKNKTIEKHEEREL